MCHDTRSVSDVQLMVGSKTEGGDTLRVCKRWFPKKIGNVLILCLTTTNKRSSASASGLTNAFFNARLVYFSHLRILFPDSKGSGVPFPLRLVEPAQHTGVSGERGTHTKPRGRVLPFDPADCGSSRHASAVAGSHFKVLLGKQER